MNGKLLLRTQSLKSKQQSLNITSSNIFLRKSCNLSWTIPLFSLMNTFNCLRTVNYRIFLPTRIIYLLLQILMLSILVISHLSKQLNIPNKSKIYSKWMRSKLIKNQFLLQRFSTLLIRAMFIKSRIGMLKIRTVQSLIFIKLEKEMWSLSSIWICLQIRWTDSSLSTWEQRRLSVTLLVQSS